METRYLAFRGELYGLRIDKTKFSKAFDERLKRLIRQAAREWLRAVVVRVPVWTGFARGGIAFAQGFGGDLARYLNVAVPISPVSNHPKTYRHSDGRVVPKVPERAGVFSEYNFPSVQHRYRFSFRSDVVHFIINDFYGSKVSGPWGSLDAGARAFHKYIRENIGSLPQVTDYLIKVPIEIGSQSQIVNPLIGEYPLEE